VSECVTASKAFAVVGKHSKAQTKRTAKTATTTTTATAKTPERKPEKCTEIPEVRSK